MEEAALVLNIDTLSKFYGDDIMLGQFKYCTELQVKLRKNEIDRNELFLMWTVSLVDNNGRYILCLSIDSRNGIS